jgi:hypothetical protein
MKNETADRNFHIERFPGNLEVWKNGECANVQFDGLAGEYTRQIWIECFEVEDIAELELTEEETDRVLFALEQTSNIPFFAED